MTQSDTQSQKAVSWSSYDAPFDSWFGLVRHVAAGGLAGLAAGVLVGGAGSRVFMRIAGAASGTRGSGRITEAGFTVGEITVAGTIVLVVSVGVFSGVVGAGMYLAMRPWLGWARKWRGVVFGIVLFALTSATSDVMNPDNRDFSILGNTPLLVALIVGLFVGFGVLTDGAFGWLNDHLPGKNEAWLPVGFLYGAVAVLGAILVLLFTSAITLGAEEFCGCSSPVWASWSFLVVLVSTTTMWIAAIVRLPSWVERTAAVAGYLGTAGVLTFGLLRALSDATDIIN